VRTLKNNFSLTKYPLAEKRWYFFMPHLSWLISARYRLIKKVDIFGTESKPSYTGNHNLSK